MSTHAEQVELNLEPDREEILKQFGEQFRSGVKEREGNEPGPPAEAGRPAPGSDAPVKTDAPVARDTGGNRDAAVAKPAPEPFAGFNDLKPEMQAEFRRMQGERDYLKGQHASLIGRVPGLQREVETLRQQLARPQANVTQANVAASLKKFEEYKARFPEDAEAIQELTDNLQSKLANSTNPLTDKVAQLEARVSEYDAKVRGDAAQREADRLSTEHPDWRRIAGWEDDQGNYIADPKARQWHPWFTSWKSQLPAEIQADYDAKLSQPNSVLIGHVLSHFERDVKQHMAASGDSPPAAGATDVSQRRSDALRDISPRPSRSGSEPAASTPFSGQPGDADRQAVLDQFYKDFKAGRKLS